MGSLSAKNASEKFSRLVTFKDAGRYLLPLVQGMERYILLLVKVGEVSLVLIERIERFTRHLLKGLMGLSCL
jgi:hypothetical protein